MPTKIKIWRKILPSKSVKQLANTFSLLQYSLFYKKVVYKKVVLDQPKPSGSFNGSSKKLKLFKTILS